MRTMNGALALLLCLAGPACAASSGQSVVQPAKVPAQDAFVAAHPGSGGCVGNARLLSHAAYQPSEARALSCGAPLPTDTLVTVHRWDRT